MTNKFTVGSQWMTQGGWRAVVVHVDSNIIKVWHSGDNGYETIWHKVDGVAVGHPECNLLTPYVDPCKGTVWVNIWWDIKSSCTCSVISDTYEDHKEDLPNEFYTLIASFKHDWTEGETVK